jgi:hypothetical protein
MTMDDAAWTRLLDSLTPERRRLAQAIMARISYVLDRDRIITIEDMQGLEDRAANQQRQIKADETRQDDADARMDADEEEMHHISDRVADLEHAREAGA